MYRDGLICISDMQVNCVMQLRVLTYTGDFVSVFLFVDIGPHIDGVITEFAPLFLSCAHLHNLTLRP